MALWWLYFFSSFSIAAAVRVQPVAIRRRPWTGCAAAVAAADGDDVGGTGAGADEDFPTMLTLAVPMGPASAGPAAENFLFRYISTRDYQSHLSFQI